MPLTWPVGRSLRCFALLASLAALGAKAEETQQHGASASDQVRCAQVQGQPMSACTADVARSADGDVIVTVTFPNGFSRALQFSAERFVRANPTMSGVGTNTEWRLERGRYLIRVEDQRYELPAPLISGQ
jgi:hypothetical protein